MTSFPDEASATTPRLYFIEKLEEIRRELNPNAFKLGIVTDSHFDEGTWRTEAYRSLKNLNNMLYMQDDLDAIAALGDNVDSEHKDKTININNLKRYCDRLSQGNNRNKFIVRGNHDAGTLVWDTTNAGNKVFEKDILTGREQLAIFKQYLDQDGNVYNFEGQYHYKDFPDKKIRLIVIDTIDIPTVMNPNGSLKYVDQWKHGVQQNQLKWLADIALGKMPDEYHAILVTHVPIQKDGVEDGAIQNDYLLKRLLTAFVNKKHDSLVSATPDFEVNLNVDFSKRTQANLAGFFAGHRHAEYFYTPSEMGGYHSIVLDCAFVKDASKIGTVQEDALAFIEVDTTKRHVVIKGFGRTTNREYDY